MYIEHPPSMAQIHFLRPLKKWRILSLKDLKNECHDTSSFSSFTRRIYRLEKDKNLLESFIDPYTKEKYVFLSQKGASYVSEKSDSPSLSPQTIIHDAKVSKLTRAFLKLELFRHHSLEHEYKQQLFTNKARADAILTGKKKKRDFQIALELELTRKAKPRIKNKIIEHLINNRFDYILYYFQDESLLKAYKRIIEEEYEIKTQNRVLYALNAKLMLKDFKFDETIIYATGKTQNILEVFDVSG